MITDPLLGQQLDNFQIQVLLGRGGMARVYKGIDTRLKRPVAIKVIEESLRDGENYRERFEREAQAIASLNHPNIVAIYQFGERDNLYYLVMEYVDGKDLDAIMHSYQASRELVPHVDILRIMEAIGSALDYAHGKGVIHRDVKPSNVVLEKSGRPVLTDFGLALRVGEGTHGGAFGSPHYIAPEQARSSANAVPQSDLYSLGVVAYELLTGFVPFDDPSPTALAMQHIMAVVPPPRDFNPNLSPDFEPVLFKALAKAPGERYQTAAEFVTALRSAFEQQSLNPISVSTPEIIATAPDRAPRRLSLQTVTDKVFQEMAAAPPLDPRLPTPPVSADKTAPTPKVTTNASQSSGWRPYALAGSGALIGLIALILILGKLMGGSPIAATDTAISTNTPILPSATLIAAAPSIQPTVSLPPPTTLIPLTAAPSIIPPTTTPIPPSVTPSPVPPTETPVIPTSSPLPPTALPSLAPPTTVHVLPSVSPVAQATTTSAITATVAYPTGIPVQLIWNSQGFMVANQAPSQSQQIVAAYSLSFEQLNDAGTITASFDGGRWARYFPNLYPGGCMVLDIKIGSFQYTSDQCPSGTNARIAAVNGENFWLPQNGGTLFRILWNKIEVGRCLLVASPCTLKLPPH